MKTRAAMIKNLILSGLLVGSACASAQSPETTNEDEWEHSVVVYMLAPTIDGIIGTGQLESEVNIDPGTVLDTLDGALLAGYVGEKGQWGVLIDLVYMDLSADFYLEGTNRSVTGRLGNTQTILSASGLMDLSEKWQLTAGVIFTDVDIVLAFSTEMNDRRISTGDSWVDPLVGLRYVTDLSDRWSFIGLGQVGGFGVNADLTYQLSASFDYQMTERTKFTAGYRFLSFDYETGSGRDYFKFDTTQQGPAVGVTFNF